ncbi:hypothetical protein EDD15DRAFT_2311656 [Pisolithus albus]|nr:hypothetical protein EDD15DRAFT_2311656 [Pisolithus albus]
MAVAARTLLLTPAFCRCTDNGGLEGEDGDGRVYTYTKSLHVVCICSQSQCRGSVCLLYPPQHDTNLCSMTTTTKCQLHCSSSPVETCDLVLLQ